jgi:hypothetical protein
MTQKLPQPSAGSALPALRSPTVQRQLVEIQLPSDDGSVYFGKTIFFFSGYSTNEKTFKKEKKVFSLLMTT